MWIYEKVLQYPVKIKRSSPALARVIISQLGGPDGEMGAATRYLSQRYGMPYPEISGILTDVGTEELGHVEMVSTLLYQLTRSMTIEDIKKSGFDTYFVDHTAGVYPQAASGVPFSASTIQSTGDVIADLNEDLAAEQKARTTYDNILRLSDDPDVSDVIKFLRAREIVHYQRFAEALGIAQERSDCKQNFYITNPSFDNCSKPDCGNFVMASAENRSDFVTKPIHSEIPYKFNENSKNEFVLNEEAFGTNKYLDYTAEKPATTRPNYRRTDNFKK